MANVYFGSDVEDFIFDESATYEEACSSKKEGSDADTEDPEVSDDEMNECGVIECVDDPEVACYRIALENEQNYNMVMNAFMAQEFSVLESTGAEMVYEAADVKKFFAGIQQVLSNFWGKVQGVFKKVIDKIGSFIDVNRAFVKKYKGAKINTPDKEFDGYKFTGNHPLFTSVKNILKSQVETPYLGQIATITNDKADEKVKAFKDDFDSIKNYLRGAMCGNDNKPVKEADFAKSLKISMYGSENKVKIKGVPFGELISELESGRDAKKASKESYNNAKSGIMAIKAEIKKAEKDLGKSENKSAGMRLGKCLTDAVNASVSIMSVGLSAHVKAINAKLSQTRSMAAYYVSHNPKDSGGSSTAVATSTNQKKAQKESAIEKELGITLI